MNKNIRRKTLNNVFEFINQEMKFLEVAIKQKNEQNIKKYTQTIGVVFIKLAILNIPVHKNEKGEYLYIEREIGDKLFYWKYEDTLVQINSHLSEIVRLKRECSDDNTYIELLEGKIENEIQSFQQIGIHIIRDNELSFYRFENELEFTYEGIING